MMRFVVRGLRCVLVLVGALWTLQGANLLGGSVMSGSSMWLVIGLVALVAGIGWWCGRSAPAAPERPDRAPVQRAATEVTSALRSGTPSGVVDGNLARVVTVRRGG